MSDAVVPVARTYCARNGRIEPSWTFFQTWSAPPPTPRIAIAPPVPTNSALGMSGRGLASLGTTGTARRAGAVALSATWVKISAIGASFGHEEMRRAGWSSGAARSFEGSDAELEELDRLAVRHLAADPLRRVEVDERLVGEGVAQDLRLGPLGDQVARPEVAERDRQ